MTKLPTVPSPTAAQKYLRVPLSSLTESASNPRKTFDLAKLKELAESIAIHGVLQAPVVRPLRVKGELVPDRWEIVFGHRRVRALGLTDRTDVEVLVLDMDDHDAAGKQLVENDQREDITPLERAEGYRKLQKEHKLSVDEIAERVKKSRASVYSAIKLCDLVPAGKKEVLAGELQPSVAELIAALPNPEHQLELVQKALGRFGEDWRHTEVKLSFREMKELVRDEYMLKLSTAPFDISDPFLTLAGSCTVCPKRTGAAQIDLLEDGTKKSDSCLDKPCWGSKVAAHKRAVVKEAKADARPVLNAGESKAALSGRYDSAWVKLTDSLSTSANGKTTVAAALKGTDLEAQLAISESGRLVKVAKKADVKKALAAKGSKLADSHQLQHSGSDRAPATKEDKAEAERKRAEAEAAELLHKKVAQTAIAKVVEHIEKKGLTGDLLLLVVARIVSSSNSGVAYERRGLKIANRWGGDAKDFHKHFGDANDREILGMLFEVCDEEITDSRQGEYSSTLAEACSLAGVSLGKLEEELAPKPAKKKQGGGQPLEAGAEGRE